MLVGERTGGRWRLGRAAARVVCEALVPSEYQLLLEGCRFAESRTETDGPEVDLQGFRAQLHTLAV